MGWVCSELGMIWIGGAVDACVPEFIANSDASDGVDVIDTTFGCDNALASDNGSLGGSRLVATCTDGFDCWLIVTAFDFSSEGFLFRFNNESEDAD